MRKNGRKNSLGNQDADILEKQTAVRPKGRDVTLEECDFDRQGPSKVCESGGVTQR